MKKQWSEWIWDGWCILSGFGIWPRYIEPRLLEVIQLNLSIPQLPDEFVGLKLLHFSDLHWSDNFSSNLKMKLIRKINHLKPDLIFFTGDFLCRSKLENPNELKETLNLLEAKIGCFAVLGNHDYAQFVTVNSKGNYDVERLATNSTNIGKGFRRLFQTSSLTGHITENAMRVGYHEELIELLKKTSFRLLNNATIQVFYRGKGMNICGLEEYSLGRFNPKEAFKNYDKSCPGVVLSHHPDTLEMLKEFPGDLILCGHTHGGQVNLPGIWKRFTQIKHPQFKSGLKKIAQKWAYINRGISSVLKFRWFAAPELTLLTLKRGSL